MPVPVLEFTTDNWVDVPTGASRVRIYLRADPPVAASSVVAIYSRPISPPDGGIVQWSKIRVGGIDNIPGTTEATSLEFEVFPGNYYSFKLQGQAHLLMPGYIDITLGFSLIAVGSEFFDYGGSQTTNGTAAAIAGTTFLHYGA